MKTTLLKLVLTNFKGISGPFDFTDGRNVYLGANGTGKTTLFDAERWLKYGKDSQGKEKFDIKTIVDGESMTKVEHSVTGFYEVDGVKLKMHRVYREKWTKKRNKLNPDHTGHVTDYRINDNAKTTKGQFDKKVGEIFGENYQICTDLKYFASLPWKKAREILVKMGNVDIDTESLIDSIPKLRKLMEGKTIDSARAYADERKTAINQEMQTLPSRIDERQKDIQAATADHSGVTLVSARQDAENAEKSVKEANQKISDFKSGSENVKKLRILNEQLGAEDEKLSDERREARVKKQNRQSEIDNLTNQIKTKSEALKDHQEEESRLLGAYKKERARNPEDDHPCSYYNQDCPYFGIEVPEAKLQEFVDNFNINRAQRLEANVLRGKDVAKESDLIKDEIGGLSSVKEELEAVADDPILSVYDNDETKGLKSKIEVVKSSILLEEVPEDLTKSLESAREDLTKFQEIEAGIKVTENSAKRIQELKDQMKGLSEENDRIEEFLRLHDQYNKQLAEQTEGPVNELFKYVKFRMFIVQVNTAINPTCDILNNEMMPYETAMSDGEKVRAGIDMLKTFQDYFEISGPVFIDGAESITTPIEIACQTIELRASADHKQLTKEV